MSQKLLSPKLFRPKFFALNVYKILDSRFHSNLFRSHTILTAFKALGAQTQRVRGAPAPCPLPFLSKFFKVVQIAPIFVFRPPPTPQRRRRPWAWLPKTSRRNNILHVFFMARGPSSIQVCPSVFCILSVKNICKFFFQKK